MCYTEPRALQNGFCPGCGHFANTVCIFVSSFYNEVNLYEQTLSVYDQNQLVFATLIATGAEPYFTQPGLHQIYLKKELETMTGAFEADKSDYYYLADVPWTMYYDGARALHGAYWRAVYG